MRAVDTRGGRPVPEATHDAEPRTDVTRGRVWPCIGGNGGLVGFEFGDEVVVVEGEDFPAFDDFATDFVDGEASLAVESVSVGVTVVVRRLFGVPIRERVTTQRAAP